MSLQRVQPWVEESGVGCCCDDFAGKHRESTIVIPLFPPHDQTIHPRIMAFSFPFSSLSPLQNDMMMMLSGVLIMSKDGMKDGDDDDRMHFAGNDAMMEMTRIGFSSPDSCGRN
jgi:hypothetical protein